MNNLVSTQTEAAKLTEAEAYARSKLKEQNGSMILDDESNVLSLNFYK